MDALKWILGLIIVLLQGCTVYAEQDHPSGERSKENRSDNLRQEQEYWTPERMREAKPAELPHVPITPTLERPTIKDEQLPAPTEENGFPGSEQIFQPDEQK